MVPATGLETRDGLCKISLATSGSSFRGKIEGPLFRGGLASLLSVCKCILKVQEVNGSGRTAITGSVNLLEREL